MANSLVRGTTPNIECRFAGDVSYNRFMFSVGSDLETPWFSVRWNEMQTEYDKRHDVTVIKFQLTQQQTLSCKPGKAIAQFRAIDKSGFATVSNAVSLDIVDILKDGVISYA